MSTMDCGDILRNEVEAEDVKETEDSDDDLNEFVQVGLTLVSSIDCLIGSLVGISVSEKKINRLIDWIGDSIIVLLLNVLYRILNFKM